MTTVVSAMPSESCYIALPVNIYIMEPDYCGNCITLLKVFVELISSYYYIPVVYNTMQYA